MMNLEIPAVSKALILTALAGVGTCLLCAAFYPQSIAYIKKIQPTKPEQAAQDAEITADPKSRLRVSQALLQFNLLTIMVLQLVLDTLIEEICFGLSLTKFFSHENAPELFVIYAHDQEQYGTANARVVRSIIKYLELIGSKTRSDRIPVFAADTNLRPRDDILVNQFCLLPRRIAINPVDKVLLCYSEVLRSCCVDSNSRKYVEDIRKAVVSALKRFQSDHTGHVTLSDERILTIQDAVRAVVSRSVKAKWFHHVLTEIALLDLRTSLEENPLSIVPVDLNPTDTILEDLTFLIPTQHYHVRPPNVIAQIDASQRTHVLFFNLLERIYAGGQLPSIVIWLRKLYESGIQQFPSTKLLSATEFKQQLRYDIIEELKRAVTVPLNIPWSPRAPLEIGEQEWAVRMEPIKPVPWPPYIIPPDLLGQPTTRQKGYLQLLEFRDIMTGPEPIVEAASHTLDWLFEHESYQLWYRGDAGMLGIRGGPGTGKSTAMKALIDSELPRNGINHLVFYFFFRYEHGPSRTRVGMYKILLWQILHKIPDAGAKFWEWAEMHSESTSVPTWNADILRELFIQALSFTIRSARVRIYLDALDEAGDIEAREVIADLRRITQEVGFISKGLGICYACRYYPSNVVDNGPQIRLEDQNYESIHSFVKSSLYEVGELHYGDGEALQRLLLIITEKSQGMFILASLAVERVKHGLLDGEPLDSMENRVDYSLFDEYETMIKKIYRQNPGDVEKIVALFRWICFARRPMTLEELRYALGSDTTVMNRCMASTQCITAVPAQPIVTNDVAMLEFVQRYSQSFTTILELTGSDGELLPTVRFIHETVFEFFSNGPRLPYEITGGNEWVGLSNDKLARTCYQFIKGSLVNVNTSHDQVSENFSHCMYAVQFWFNHVAEADSRGISQDYLIEELGPKAEEESALLLQQWARAYADIISDNTWLEEPANLYNIASAFNIQGILQKPQEEDSEEDSEEDTV